MPYVPAIKDSLLIPSGQGNHLFIVITPACRWRHHLLVSISTVRGIHDPSCLIKPGEHRFVKVDSYAVYRLARTESVDRLARCVDNRVFTLHDPISDDLLDRLRDGLSTSNFVSPRILKYYRGAEP